ncbi:hypothetical protein AB1N83_007443 [Pleurotus pulmonarius]
MVQAHCWIMIGSPSVQHRGVIPKYKRWRSTAGLVHDTGNLGTMNQLDMPFYVLYSQSPMSSHSLIIDIKSDLHSGRFLRRWLSQQTRRRALAPFAPPSRTQP